MPYYDQSTTTAAIAAAGVLGSAYVGYKLYQRRNQLPTQWTQVGTLKDLYVYPIKSCAPVVLDKAEVSALGLRQGWLRDRVLMVIDEKNNFITARAYPELFKVLPSVKSSVLTLKHVDMDDLCVNLAELIESGIEPKTASVWNVPVPVYDCGWEASQWFSKLLNRPDTNFRLVYYASQKARGIRGQSKFYKFTTVDTGAFPDEFSFNLINEASVTDLNTRLSGSHVSHRHFRPNFVLDGATAYDEDKWQYVKIGDSVFEVIKPCTRCIMTTMDPETGVRDERSEPLEMLKRYRQIEDPEESKASGRSPRMGLQMALRSEPGKLISLNDPIYVAYK